jgi:hypothetical protein
METNKLVEALRREVNKIYGALLDEEITTDKFLAFLDVIDAIANRIDNQMRVIDYRLVVMENWICDLRNIMEQFGENCPSIEEGEGNEELNEELARVKWGQ